MIKPNVKMTLISAAILIVLAAVVLDIVIY